MREHHGCPVQATSNAISGKWKVMLLWHLSTQPYRFSQLRELLQGISEKVLTAQLRELEADGLIVRMSAQTVPPRVEYRLSLAGQELIPILERMCDWARVHLGVFLARPPQQQQEAWGSPSVELR